MRILLLAFVFSIITCAAHAQSIDNIAISYLDDSDVTLGDTEACYGKSITVAKLVIEETNIGAFGNVLPR